ncbi:GspE/PulE family protein [Desulfothermus okinawensis JCM 13304]
MARKKLGEILVAEGLLTPEQLTQALKEKPSSQRLGEYLIRSGMVKEDELVRALSRQLNIPFFVPERYSLDPSLQKVLPYEIASKNRVVPLGVKDRIITLGMEDPLDLEAVDEVEIFTDKEVDPVVCTPSQIDQLLSTLYGSDQDLTKVIDEIDKLEITTAEESDVEGELEISNLAGLAEEAPVIRVVNSILSQAVKENASDVHISPEKERIQLRFRIDGILYERPAPPKKMFLAIASRIKILANLDIANTRIPQDGRFTIRLENKEINVRVSTLPTIYGENVVLRLLDMSRRMYTLEQLGFDKRNREIIEEVVKSPYGMILATGPTGSGKSTTLYTILNMINTPDINIITLEDPVEYRMKNIRQVQLNRKAGMTFASGLRSILRQDPDVVMVGEIRDGETAQISVQAALTGHKLLSTVHTNDAASAITRLIDMGIEPFLVASTLLVSIAQRLVRRICPYCEEEYIPDANLIEFLGLSKEDIKYKRGKGCPQCHHTGFIGRMGVYEILRNDEQVQELTVKNVSSKRITRELVEAGKLRTLKDDVLEKVRHGLTTLEEAIKVIIS